MHITHFRGPPSHCLSAACVPLRPSADWHLSEIHKTCKSLWPRMSYSCLSRIFRLWDISLQFGQSRCVRLLTQFDKLTSSEEANRVRDLRFSLLSTFQEGLLGGHLRSQLCGVTRRSPLLFLVCPAPISPLPPPLNAPASARAILIRRTTFKKRIKLFRKRRWSAFIPYLENYRLGGERSGSSGRQCMPW